MRSRVTRYTLVLGLATIAAGCRGGTAPDSSLRAAAGVYLPATVNGGADPTSDPSAPIRGTVYLWPTGQAERHVTYRAYDGTTQDVESVGSFHFENQAIVLELRARGDSSPTPWSVHGSLDRGTLTLGYPGPADGWMREEYRRK